ncbi:HD-GYP domain-containing protein [Clostridium neonatale]|uniref:HD-GYP domain-containing protein n=1 Tax=Clostridium neonatale TaxID=137838 RepID=UPI001E317985|nr:HD domain-containing phosphohydrolase [Clostridium neonatale]
MDNKYREDEILKITTLAMFHDIGAYKIEERKKLIEIELNRPMEHAVYGSLFIKYFSPLSDLSPLILGHHMYPKDLDEGMAKIIPKDSLLLHLADIISVFYLNFKTIKKEWIMDKSDDEILPEHKKLFEIACDRYNLLEKLEDNRYIEEIYEIFDKKILTREEVISYAKMLDYAIDFRSKATVVHTISVQEINVQIANIINLGEETTMKIKIASMLHDIGKISIPVEILERQGKLTLEEYDKIKNHAIVGYRILSDLGLDDIRDISALHHEKLDGTGYPFKLKDSEISLEVRIVAIADIISALVGKRSYKGEFPKETVISILSDMALNNKIDSDICNIVIDKYDFILGRVRANTKETLTIYNNIMKEYEDLLSNFEKIGLFNRRLTL